MKHFITEKKGGKRHWQLFFQLQALYLQHKDLIRFHEQTGYILMAGKGEKKKKSMFSQISILFYTEVFYQYSNIHLFSFFLFLLWLPNHVQPIQYLFWHWSVSSFLFCYIHDISTILPIWFHNRKCASVGMISFVWGSFTKKEYLPLFQMNVFWGIIICTWVRIWIICF